MRLSRTQLERREAATLVPYAVKSGQSKGREHSELLDLEEVRTCFRKDIDRITHTDEYRKLKGKTQVFVAHGNDLFRTRSDHTEEVELVSVRLCQALGLNEDLAKAIARGHDLGHTPFGHAGEEMLNECLRELGLDFEHNQHSVRLVTELIKQKPEYSGLNLSREVIEGLMKHETQFDTPDGVDGVRPSLEAQVVNLADEIAYTVHDIDDGLRAGLITEGALSTNDLFRRAVEAAEASHGKMEGDAHTRRISIVSKLKSILMADVVKETSRRLQELKVETLEDVYACEDKLVGYSDEVEQASKALKTFLFNNMYMHEEVLKHTRRGKAVIHVLFDHYIKDWEPEKVRNYLAGMTDRYALLKVEELELGPKVEELMAAAREQGQQE